MHAEPNAWRWGFDDVYVVRMYIGVLVARMWVWWIVQCAYAYERLKKKWKRLGKRGKERRYSVTTISLKWKQEKQKRMMKNEMLHINLLIICWSDFQNQSQDDLRHIPLASTLDVYLLFTSAIFISSYSMQSQNLAHIVNKLQEKMIRDQKRKIKTKKPPTDS